MNPLKSLVISEKKGLPLKFRILIPPNLPAVAPRDRIIIKVEVDIQGECMPPEKINRGHAYWLEPPHLLTAMLIESWCEEKLFGLLELSRDRLSQLLQPLQDQPAVFSIKDPQKPLAWVEGKLSGVHEHLVVEPPAPCEDIPMVAAAPDAEERRRVAEQDLTPMVVDGSTQFLAISLPSRESVVYPDALELVKGYRFKLEPSNRKWWLRGRHQTLNFLSAHWKDLREKYRARFTGNFTQRTGNIQMADVEFRAEETRGGFEVSIDIEADCVDGQQIQHSLAKGQQYVENGDTIVLIDQAQLDQLAETQRKLSGEKDRSLTPRFRQTLSHAELVGAETALEALNLAEQTPETWKKRSQALKQLHQLKTAPVRKHLDDQLRSYQRIGVAWFAHLYRNDLGGVLADEMGLGKTVQALAFLECIHTSGGNAQPSLVVCPAGLVENWRREALKFVPAMQIYCHRGLNRTKDAAVFNGCDLVITSYGTLTRDTALIASVDFDCVIADEAQHVKNRQTQNARALRRLRCKGRFLLTGTPIENSLDDLYSLFEFIMPGYLRTPPVGVSREDKQWYHRQMRDRVAPYILRRTKAAVAPELPGKIEQVVYCDMGDKQARFYRDIEQQTQQEIFNMEMANAHQGQLRLAALQQLLRLRQICADPRLLDATYGEKDSAKLRAFREILQESIDGGHRILVFSQFVSMLTLLRKELEQQGLDYCYIDGQTKDRLGECDRFNGDDGIPVFLISLKAGGTGLNLTGADTVIHYDPWWNPAVEAQATDRAHRIGQERVVTSIKMIAASTVEEKVLALQQEKAGLLRDLLDASDMANAKVGLDDIKALFNFEK